MLLGLPRISAKSKACKHSAKQSWCFLASYDDKKYVGGSLNFSRIPLLFVSCFIASLLCPYLAIFFILFQRTGHRGNEKNCFSKGKDQCHTGKAVLKLSQWCGKITVRGCNQWWHFYLINYEPGTVLYEKGKTDKGIRWETASTTSPTFCTIWSLSSEPQLLIELWKNFSKSSAIRTKTSKVKYCI